MTHEKGLTENACQLQVAVTPLSGGFAYFDTQQAPCQHEKLDGRLVLSSKASQT
jgi:hypothetical protein